MENLSTHSNHTPDNNLQVVGKERTKFVVANSKCILSLPTSIYVVNAPETFMMIDSVLRFFSIIVSSDDSTTSQYSELRRDDSFSDCCSINHFVLACAIVVLTIAFFRYDIREWPNILSKTRPEKQPKISLIIASCVEEVSPPIGATIIKAAIVVLK